MFLPTKSPRRTRCSSLQEAGYEVTARASVKEASDVLKHENFDAVIIGHRFSAEEKYRLVVEARRRRTRRFGMRCRVGF